MLGFWDVGVNVFFVVVVLFWWWKREYGVKIRKIILFMWGWNWFLGKYQKEKIYQEGVRKTLGRNENMNREKHWRR